MEKKTQKIVILMVFVLTVVFLAAFLLSKFLSQEKSDKIIPEQEINLEDANNWEIYNDSNFGYSFYYPKTWKVSFTDNAVTITNFGPNRNEEGGGDVMTISEIHDSKAFVSDGKFGDTTLYYEDDLKQWMKTAPEEYYQTYETKPAEVAFNTISGLPVYSSTGRWKTVIIPLSHIKFLILNITGGGYTDALEPFASTIVELDADVSISAINAAVTAASEDDDLAFGPKGTVMISSLSENHGPIGTEVTINGKGFLSIPSEKLQQDPRWKTNEHVTVLLRSYPYYASSKSATIFVGIPSSDTSITVTISDRICGYVINPSSHEVCEFYTIITPGKYTISVYVYGQQRTNHLPFTITGTAVSDVPVMTFLEPSFGPVGTQVTIHGYNFTGREGINIGNVPLYTSPSYVSPDGKRLIFTVPTSNLRFTDNSYSVVLTASNGGSISNSLIFTLTQ